MKYSIYAIVLFGLLTFGCATRNEVKRFQLQLDYIEASNAKMQKDIGRLDSLVIAQQRIMREMKAEQNISLSQLDQNMKVIVSILDDSGLRVSKLNEEVENLRRDVIYKPQKEDDDTSAADSLDTLANENSVPMLEQIYESAYLDQKRGNYEMAIENYQFFLDEMAEQESDIADDAQYGIAECLFSLEKYTEASVQYQKLIDLYPDSELIAPSLFKKGLIYQRQDQLEKAKIVFNRLIESYPRSPEANLAEDRLKNMK
ncbi:MAG: tetratricopeptide repeat protein [Candidatus Zixiibacteriota bacterium]